MMQQEQQLQNNSNQKLSPVDQEMNEIYKINEDIANAIGQLERRLVPLIFYEEGVCGTESFTEETNTCDLVRGLSGTKSTMKTHLSRLLYILQGLQI